MAVHRVAKGSLKLSNMWGMRTLEVRPDGSTKGKMKLYRKIVKAEVIDPMLIAGAGRFNTDIPSTRRI